MRWGPTPGFAALRQIWASHRAVRGWPPSVTGRLTRCVTRRAWIVRAVRFSLRRERYRAPGDGKGNRGRVHARSEAGNDPQDHGRDGRGRGREPAAGDLG